MRYELVLFDMDNTLFDFSAADRAAFETALDTHGVKPKADSYARFLEISQVLWGMAEQDADRSEVNERCFEESLELDGIDYAQMAEDYQDGLAHQFFLSDGALEACRELAKVCKIGIVVNGFSKIVHSRLEGADLAPLMTAIAISEECGSEKPQPEIFLHAIKEANHSNLKTVLMVGDKLADDVIGANKAGIASCWFNPSVVFNDTDVHPTHEIRRFNELLDLVR